MARIYSSRTLLDPSMLSAIGSATEGRIRSDAERRRNVLGAVQSMLGSVGKLVDERVDRNRADELYRKRYSDVAWQSSDEQMRDPMYRAAVEEYARTGSSAPLTQYTLGLETREANRLERVRSAAEKADLDRRNKEAEASAAYPSYLEAITKSIEANKAGNKKEALIYSEQASALQKKYDYKDAALTGLFEAEEAERELAEARKEAERELAETRKEDEEWQKEQVEKKARKSREMRDFVETNFIPTTMKNADDKNYSYRIVNDLKNTLTDEDYKYLRDLISGKKTTAEAVSAATQGAVAGAAGKKTEKKIEETENVKDILKRLVDLGSIKGTDAKILADAIKNGLKLTDEQRAAWKAYNGGK